jgi:hypothetical protein
MKIIDKLGKIVEESDKMILICPPDGCVYVESPYFTYADVQKFIYLLSRTQCEWYIYPAETIERGVRLKVRLF